MSLKQTFYQITSILDEGQEYKVNNVRTVYARTVNKSSTVYTTNKRHTYIYTHTVSYIDKYVYQITDNPIAYIDIMQ